MPDRIRTVKLPALIATAVVATFLSPTAVHAHRLDAQAFVLPNRKVQVESWFSSGDAAKGANVQVFDALEQLIIQGQLNEQGVFVFSYGDVLPHTVVVSAGAGHRKVLSIATGALEQAGREMPTKSEGSGRVLSPSPLTLVERSSGPPIKDLLIGVGLVLALAAFVLSLRNAQKLRMLHGPNQKP
ncbi:MAG TPA: hypothetical protein VKU02_05295 [Gemmataceae bacterium]|nr:hypothetical protein [Gemmataceae bacterium]